MSVTERLMQPGTFDLTLLPDTPRSLYNVCDFFGHIFIFDGPVDHVRLGDAGMQANARYAGILRRRVPQTYGLSGIGMLGWIGDDNGKGPTYEVANALTNGTFAGWIAALIPVASSYPIRPGVITAIGGTVTQSFIYVTARTALDWIMKRFAGEYRVRYNGTLDAGPSSALFNTTPTSIISRRGGRDPSLTGVEIAQFTSSLDVEDFLTRLIYTDATGARTATGTGGGDPYRDLYGGLLQMSAQLSDGNTPAAQAAAMAGVEYASRHQIRREVSLSSEDYDIGKDVAVGDFIWVYDVLAGVTDETNQVRYRGNILFPVNLRVYGSTWPIERPMGVYYRACVADVNGNFYTDLTPYVNWEQPGTTFEVGASTRSLTTG